MKSKDIATLKLSSEGGQAVAADIARVNKAISDIKHSIEGWQIESRRLTGEIGKQKSEITKSGNEIEKQNKIVARASEKNKELQAKIKELTDAGKTGQKQFENATRRLAENNIVLQEAQTKVTQLTQQHDEQKNVLQGLQASQKEYNRLIKEGKNEIGQHEGTVKNLNATLNLNQLSIKQLRERQRELRKELNGISKELYPDKWNKLNNELQAVEKQLDKVVIGGKKTNDSFDRMKGTVIMATKAFIAFKALQIFQNILREVGEFIKKAPEVAAKAEGIQKAFNKLNDSKLLSTLRADTKGLVNDILLMQSTVKASSFGIPIQNLSKYLKFAQQRAQETGESVDYLTESIINGIGRKSPLILDNLGISAARLKKEMSGGADIIQATTKIVEEELAKQGDLALTTADKAAQANVKWENAQLKLGQRLTSFSSFFSEVSGRIADSISRLSGETRNSMQIYEDQLTHVSDLNVNIIPLIEKYEKLSKTVVINKNNTGDFNEEETKLLGLIDKIRTATHAAANEFDEHGRIISINTQTAWEYISAQKEILKYTNMEAIAYQEKNRQMAESVLLLYQTRKAQGGTHRVVGGGNTGGGTTVFDAFTPEQVAELDNLISTTQEKIKNATNAINQLNGTSLIDRQIARDKETEKVNEFNAMKKHQLKAWINDEKNATSQYLVIAKQRYSAMFGADTEIDDETENKLLARQKKELDTQLTNLENAHKKELQLLQETKLKEKQTDEEYKIAVAKSDKKYYADRIKTLEDYKKKVSDKKFQADIDKQVVDATGKSKEQDPIIDKSNVDKLGKNRDEQLRFEQVGTNQLKRTLATREENEKVSSLRMQTLELTSSQNRLEILRQYSKDVQELDIADARLKEELVREANDAIIVAETDTIIKRKALDKSYFDSEQSTRDKYGLVTLEQQKNEELDILKAFYAEKLISKKTYDEAEKALELKYKSEKVQAFEQYGIASEQQIFDTKIEMLRAHLEQVGATEEEIDKAIWQAKLDRAIEFSQKITQLTGMAVNMGNALQEAATAKLEAEYQVRIAAAQGNAAEQERLEQELAEKKLEIEKEYADVQFAIKASEIISSTAVAIMVAYKQLGPIMGSVAAAMLGVTGAAQLVSANAERQKVKSLTLGSSGKTSAGSGRVVVGLETGGYMDVTRQQDGKNFRASYNPNKRGYVNRPTVIVGEGRAGESLEYVIPNKAMKNPTLRPIIDLIDYESRKGTIGTVDMNQMIRGRLAGFESGGAIDTSVSTSSSSNIPTVVNGYRQPSEVELETLALLRHLSKNGVFTNLSLGSVKSGLDTMDKQDNKFRFGDQ